MNFKEKDVLISALLVAFFISKGIKDNMDLMRCNMLCIQLVELLASEDSITIDMIKNTSGYKSCLYDIPDILISDKVIEEMLNFNIKK